jgi:hypothetical protein
VSCPHAHQQNGAAKRKHRHIVEVGLALLAHASIPLKYWEDAFVAPTYLINRTPSRVIHYETPLERLFQQKPDYSSLRVFGCACWPNLHPYNTHKFQFRSKQCVFLGYSPLHKGFKCLDPSTGRVYVSWNVTFDENVFPFSQLHPNAGARLRQEISLLPPDLQPLSSDQGGELMHDHMFNPNSSCEEVCVGNGVDLADSAASEWTADRTSLPSASERTSAPVTGADRTSSDRTSLGADRTSSPVTGADRTSSGADRTSSDQTSLGADRTSSPSASGSSVLEEAALPAVAMNAPEISRPMTRLQAGTRKPKVYTDGTIQYGFFTSSGEPQNINEALGDENWKNAIDVEYSALMKNKTWHLVPP